jgi:hypothetical protein
MKRNRKKGNSEKAAGKSGSVHAAAGPQAEEPTYSRWAAFEAAVLSKVKDPKKCMKVIAQRQARVDDDSNEADLVAAHIRKKLKDNSEDPDTCCIFFMTPEITRWLQEATGTKLPINKATPYLRALAIPELRYTKKNGVPGWVWRGPRAKAKQSAVAFSKLGFFPSY